MKTKPLELQFYTKPDCPLCDEAKSELKTITSKFTFLVIDEIDISRNIGLFTKYKHLIPVLEMNGKQLFVHRVNSEKLLWQLRWYRLRRYFSRN